MGFGHFVSTDSKVSTYNLSSFDVFLENTFPTSQQMAVGEWILIYLLT